MTIATAAEKLDVNDVYKGKMYETLSRLGVPGLSATNMRGRADYVHLAEDGPLVINLPVDCVQEDGTAIVPYVLWAKSGSNPSRVQRMLKKIRQHGGDRVRVNLIEQDASRSYAVTANGAVLGLEMQVCPINKLQGGKIVLRRKL